MIKIVVITVLCTDKVRSNYCLDSAFSLLVCILEAGNDANERRSGRNVLECLIRRV